MEPKRNNNDAVAEFLRLVKQPKPADFPVEGEFNRGRVGQGGKHLIVEKPCQPHNIRRYYDFSKANFHLNNRGCKRAVRAVIYRENKKAKEHIFKNFLNCTVTVKNKGQLEVINLDHQKQYRIIRAKSRKDIKERMDYLINDMRSRCDLVARQFVKAYGGSSNFNVLKQTGEWGFIREGMFNKIPREYIIYDDVFKKSYADKIEYYNDDDARNVMLNSALHDFAPEIAGAINSLSQSVHKISVRQNENIIGSSISSNDCEQAEPSLLNDTNSIIRGLMN